MLTKSKTFSATHDQLVQILSWTHGHVKQFDFSAEECKRVELALEEAIVNILNYAASNSPLKLTISIRYLSSHQLEFELKDNGIPFNPLMHSTQDQSLLPLQERKPGGLGVLLIKRCMNAVTYRFEDGHNIRTLTKDIQQSSLD